MAGKLARMIRPASWTTNQLSAIGIVAGFTAVFLWLFYASWPEIVGWPFIVALTVAALCGIVMLVMTLRDVRRRSGRGSRLKPIRTVDLIIGLVLAVPSLVELRAIVPENLAAVGL